MILYYSQISNFSGPRKLQKYNYLQKFTPIQYYVTL